MNNNGYKSKKPPIKGIFLSLENIWCLSPEKLLKIFLLLKYLDIKKIKKK